MFGIKYRGPGAAPPKGNFKSGDTMPYQERRDEFIKTAMAHVKEALGEREKIVEAKEKRIYRMERIGRLCLAALRDVNPNLADALDAEFTDAYK